MAKLRTGQPWGSPSKHMVGNKGRSVSKRSVCTLPAGNDPTIRWLAPLTFTAVNV